MMDHSIITDWLIQGAQPTPEDYQALFTTYNVRSVLSVNRENFYIESARTIFGADNVLHVDWRDDGTPKPVEDFRRIEEWYAALPAAHKHVYVHCHQGINRSTVASIWLLTVFDHMTPYEAWGVVKSHRPSANGWNIYNYQQSILRAEQALLHRKSA